MVAVIGICLVWATAIRFLNLRFLFCIFERINCWGRLEFLLLCQVVGDNTIRVLCDPPYCSLVLEIIGPDGSNGITISEKLMYVILCSLRCLYKECTLKAKFVGGAWSPIVFVVLVEYRIPLLIRSHGVPVRIMCSVFVS